MAVFTWEVSNNTTGTSAFAPLEAKFGEGYRQVAGDGRNLPARTVSVDIGPIAEAEAIAIHNFLDAQYGLSFQWTPLKPLPQVLGNWTCKTYGFKRAGGLIHGITAEFKSLN